jgi:hypothetical protein
MTTDVTTSRSDGITDQKSLQRTFATKSVQSRHELVRYGRAVLADGSYVSLARTATPTELATFQI